jgi:hypothetical protein
MGVPVAYFVFNRPQHTAWTFNAIRAQRPSQLFIIADGPRFGHPGDVERCSAVREIVAHIDWPCRIHRDYADNNLGLKRRVSSGLNWVFGQVDRAIVLEDDCLPQPDFFTFCESLLDRFASDEHVWVITGNNFQDGARRGTASYYFSRYNHCWGWATWRRAWQHYSGDLQFWAEWKAGSDWQEMIPDQVELDYWASIFDMVARGEINSWAYPWTASVWRHGGLTATPNVNLVQNIGFGPDSTHTITDETMAGPPSFPLGVLTHPDNIWCDVEADRYVFDHHFGGFARRRQLLEGKVASRLRKCLERLAKGLIGR